MRGHRLIALAAVLMAAAVALGAFASHGLQGSVEAARLDTFRTAVEYHAWHALGLLLLGVLSRDAGFPAAPAALLLAGIILFSGSLYLLVLLDAPALGMIPPLGGAAFILGWLLLAFHASKRRGR